MKIGERIRSLRQLSNLTQDVLGKEGHHKPHTPSARQEMMEKHCDL